MRQVEVQGLFAHEGRFQLRFADATEGLSQDEEWFEVLHEGEWRRFRIHDYDQVYDIPGLYEAVVYRTLKCISPSVVVTLLRDAVLASGQATESLRVLDFGAGNGMAGQELQNLCVDSVVGIDIIKEGKTSTERDRAWCYNDYVVADLTALSPAVEQQLRDQHLNCMTIVAALGFGDIPALAFLNALDLIEAPGWLAFNIKDIFMQAGDTSGFNTLLEELTAAGVLETQEFKRYRHRLSIRGEPLYYGALVMRKLKPIPAELLSRYRQ